MSKFINNKLGVFCEHVETHQIPVFWRITTNRQTRKRGSKMKFSCRLVFTFLLFSTIVATCWAKTVQWTLPWRKRTDSLELPAGNWKETAKEIHIERVLVGQGRRKDVYLLRAKLKSEDWQGLIQGFWTPAVTLFRTGDEIINCNGRFVFKKKRCARSVHQNRKLPFHLPLFIWIGLLVCFPRFFNILFAWYYLQPLERSLERLANYFVELNFYRYEALRMQKDIIAAQSNPDDYQSDEYQLINTTASQPFVRAHAVLQ